MPLPIVIQDIFKHKQKSYNMVLVLCLLDELAKGNSVVAIATIRGSFLSYFRDREEKGLVVDIPPAKVGERWANITFAQIQSLLNTPIEALSKYLTFDSENQLIGLNPDIIEELRSNEIEDFRAITLRELETYHEQSSSQIPLKDYLEKILSTYIQAKTEAFGAHQLGAFVRQTIPQDIVKLPYIPDHCKVQGSVGQGNWADVPWIAIMDKRLTSTTQEGVYIVYLFSENMNSLYLSLAQGVTVPLQKGKKDGYAYLSEQVHQIRSLIKLDNFTLDDNIHLTSKGIGEAYQVSTIAYVRYDEENMPSNQRLLSDLEKMFNAYQSYVDHVLSQNGSSFPTFKYTMAKLSYGQGVVNYVGRNYPRAVPIEELVQNQSVVLRSGDAVKHPRERVKHVSRAYEELGLLRLDTESISLTSLGQMYFTQMEPDIWQFSKEQIQTIRDCFNQDSEQSELIKVLRLAINLAKEHKYFTLESFIPYFVGAMRVEDTWGSVTQQDRTKFMLNWLVELKYLENSGNSYTYIDTEALTQVIDSDITAHIKSIKSYIIHKGFNYPDYLIENFYLSIKTKPFVILAGISGTGKTKLVKLFAEALGATSANGQFRLIPVRSDWSDPTDLIGYKDLAGTFRPGPLTELLAEACKPENKNNPYIVCLDEMNLARVEHYFSDILSLLETQERKDGCIVSDRLVPSSQLGNEDQAKYGNIYIPDNVILIGTVNMDETTHPFSKKVLDRGNTIEFNYIKLDNYPVIWDEGEYIEKSVLPASFLSSEYLTLHEAYSTNIDLIKKTTEKLILVNTILEQIHSHIGFRVRDAICFYMAYNQRYGLMHENTAFDLQLLQKILPRIQGSNLSVKRTLLLLLKFTLNVKQFSIEEYMNEAAALYEKNVFEDFPDAPYKQSSRKLLYMIRRLDEDGYTSFWVS